MPSDDPEAGAGAGVEDKISPKFLEAFNAENAAIEKTIDAVRAATGAPILQCRQPARAQEQALARALTTFTTAPPVSISPSILPLQAAWTR